MGLLTVKMKIAMPKPTKKKRTTDMFAVIWTELGMKEYGVSPDEPFINIEPKDEIKIRIGFQNKGRPKYRYATVFPFFTSEKEAEGFRNGNKDWKIIPVTITYYV